MRGLLSNAITGFSNNIPLTLSWLVPWHFFLSTHQLLIPSTKLYSSIIYVSMDSNSHNLRAMIDKAPHILLGKCMMFTVTISCLPLPIYIGAGTTNNTVLNRLSPVSTSFNSVSCQSPVSYLMSTAFIVSKSEGHEVHAFSLRSPWAAGTALSKISYSLGLLDGAAEQLSMTNHPQQTKDV